MKNSIFAVETETDPKVRAYFAGIDKRLREGKGIFFFGKIRRVVSRSVGQKDLYVFRLAWVVDKWALLIVPYIMVGLGIFIQIISIGTGFNNTGYWTAAFGGACIAVIYAFAAPETQVFILRLGLWKKVGRAIKVRMATSEALERLAFGKV